METENKKTAIHFRSISQCLGDIITHSPMKYPTNMKVLDQSLGGASRPDSTCLVLFQTWESPHLHCNWQINFPPREFLYCFFLWKCRNNVFFLNWFHRNFIWMRNEQIILLIPHDGMRYIGYKRYRRFDSRWYMAVNLKGLSGNR